MGLTDRDDLAQVHQWTRAVLEGQRPAFDPERVRDVLLVLDELASNALLHGAGRRRVGLTVHRAHAVLEVSDDSPEPAVLPTPGHGGGLGLQLVESLSSRWGQRFRDGGKSVWARIALG
jgi:two-component sensor histidine kinase